MSNIAYLLIQYEEGHIKTNLAQEVEKCHQRKQVAYILISVGAPYLETGSAGW